MIIFFTEKFHIGIKNIIKSYFELISDFPQSLNNFYFFPVLFNQAFIIQKFIQKTFLSHLANYMEKSKIDLTNSYEYYTFFQQQPYILYIVSNSFLLFQYYLIISFRLVLFLDIGVRTNARAMYIHIFILKSVKMSQK